MLIDNPTDPETLHAFIWNDGKITDLGTLHGPEGIPGSWSTAIAINDAGWIVGSSTFGIPSRGGSVKFSKRLPTKWDPTGQASEIKIPSIESHEMPLKSLTNDGWFCTSGWVCNIVSQATRKVTYGLAGLSNQNICFTGGDPGYFIDGSKGYQPTNIPFPSNHFWNKRGSIEAMNFKGDAVGFAETHLGEQHAIILLNNR